MIIVTKFPTKPKCSACNGTGRIVSGAQTNSFPLNDATIGCCVSICTFCAGTGEQLKLNIRSPELDAAIRAFNDSH